MKPYSSIFSKQAMILVFIFVLYLGSNAQQSFISSDKIWTILFQDYVANEKYSIKYKFDGTKTINEMAYNQFWSSDSENDENWELVGYFKEVDKIVYQYEDNKDVTMYNFNLEPGDSIKFAYWFYLDSISMVLVNGAIRQEYHLSTKEGESTAWIDGIGSLNGPLNPYGSYSFWDGRTDLLCVNENNIEIFNNSEYEKCFYKTSINEYSFEKQVGIFPNPSNGFISLELPTQWKGSVEIDIIDQNGLTYLTDNFDTHDNWNMYIDTPGLYFCRVTCDENVLVKKIIIK